MKIKHFSGYGSVNATKVSKTTGTNIYGDKTTELVIKVTGNHEWGLVRNYASDLFEWLVKRFDKSVTDYYSYFGNFTYTYEDYYENGEDVCVYTFKY